jgi:hypothetical protein
MKQLVILFLTISTLFAGGNTFPIDIITKYEKIDINLANGCETCGKPAKLLPYNGEDLPEAETFPCPPIDKKGCTIP